jgi:hypothetical protein
LVEGAEEPASQLEDTERFSKHLHCEYFNL